METLVKMFYQKDTGELNITCADRTFDASKIRDLSIEQWGFPFRANGVKWNGLYQELKEFTGNDSFTLLFEGDDTSFEILRYIFQDTPANVTRQLKNAAVTLVYSEDPFVTRIMIDGVQFDTSRIQNRSIEEWMYPINVRGIQWDGIFTELEKYLNSKTYTITFIGKQSDMDILLNNCPDNVSIFYRDPKVARMMNESKAAENSEEGPDFKAVADSFSEGAKKIKDTVNSAISGDETSADDAFAESVVEETQDSELGTFIGKYFIIVCAVVLIVILIFPFVRYHIESTSAYYTVESTVERFTGFGLLFGKGVARINTAFAVVFILAPILMVFIAYFKPLRKYVKYLNFIPPVIGIIFGIVAIADISNKIHILADDPYFEEVAKISIGFGFFITIAIYIVVIIWAILQWRRRKKQEL